MSFVIAQPIYEDLSATSSWISEWEQAYQGHNATKGQDIIQRIKENTGQALGELSLWMQSAYSEDVSAKRRFFNTVMGVHQQDHEAHQKLNEILAATQSGTCYLKEHPNASPGVWLVLNAENEPIAVFKAGARRAFMEILARKIAFMLGLHHWIAPGTITAVTQVNIPLPPFDRDESVEERLQCSETGSVPTPEKMIPVKLKRWSNQDPRYAQTGGKMLSLDTFGGHLQVVHPQLFRVPQHITTGSIIGILQPYIKQECENLNIEDYDANFLGVTITALALGLSAAEPGSIVNNTIVEAKAMMPGFLADTDEVRFPNPSCATAYQQMPCSKEMLERLYQTENVLPQTIRGRRQGKVPEIILEALDGWTTATGAILRELDRVRPLFMDSEITAAESHCMDLGHPFLRKDSNGVIFHLEKLPLDPMYNPGIYQDVPPFSEEQLIAFYNRVESLENAIFQIKKTKIKYIEPFNLIRAVDPIVAIKTTGDESMFFRANPFNSDFLFDFENSFAHAEELPISVVAYENVKQQDPSIAQPALFEEDLQQRLADTIQQMATWLAESQISAAASGLRITVPRRGSQTKPPTPDFGIHALFFENETVHKGGSRTWGTPPSTPAEFRALGLVLSPLASELLGLPLQNFSPPALYARASEEPSTPFNGVGIFINSGNQSVSPRRKLPVEGVIAPKPARNDEKIKNGFPGNEQNSRSS